MKKLLKHRWNKLQSCEKKAVVVAGILLVACVALEIRDIENRGVK